jgi:parallel beta-helix repeat protein
MRTIHRSWPLLLLCNLALTAHAQGPLNPSGAPAPVFKTLDEVEPRTPITSIPFAISSSGSYFMTSNFTGVAVQNGISILADDVTLDLNGFTLTGVPGSFDGIRAIGTLHNISIGNGVVVDWGDDGIDLFSAGESHVMRIRAEGNSREGIRVGNGCTVRDCTARANQGFSGGIAAADGCVIDGCIAETNNTAGINVGSGSIVIDCIASHNREDGIEAGPNSTIADCVARSNGAAGNWNGFDLGDGTTIRGSAASNNTGDGINCEPGCVITVCSANNNGDDGIVAGAGGLVTDSTAKNNAGDGIEVSLDCRVAGNVCDNSGLSGGDGAGIHATGNENHILDNHLSDGDRGLDIDGTGNYVAGNSVVGNTDNYSFAAGNQLNLLLAEIPESIERPAVVILAGTLSATNGITVATDHVTIDLNGHGLIGSIGNAGCGVQAALEFFKNIHVRNGTIQNWGAGGICLASNVKCVIRQVSACSNVGNGISVGAQSRVSQCEALDNTGRGIKVGTKSVVSNCEASGGRNNGIQTEAECTVLDNVCRSNYNTNAFVFASGIFAGSNSHIERNLVTGNNRGIDTSFSTNCFVGNNRAGGNDANYAFGGAFHANIVAPVAVVPSGSLVGGFTNGVNEIHPQANFSY